MLKRVAFLVASLSMVSIFPAHADSGYTISEDEVVKINDAAYITGKFTNKTDYKMKEVCLIYKAYNKEKYAIESPMICIESLSPNETWLFKTQPIPSAEYFNLGDVSFPQ